MNRKALVATLLVLAAIVAPIVAYLYIFGVRLSSDHARWAEFGSAIGGIYSPLVALLTLVVLLRQVRLQSQMNVHEFDQAYLQQARADIEFYSTQMAKTLSAVAIPGKTLRSVLHENFSRPDLAELDTSQLRQLAANIHDLMPTTFDVWAAVYPILKGLETNSAPMYNMTLGSSTQKLIALLSFESCVALDNFHRTRSEGRLQVRYIFSPLLRKP